MTRAMNWDKQRLLSRTTEAARPVENGRRGAWTHVKRAPVREFDAAEKARWAAENPSLLAVQSKPTAPKNRTYEDWCYRCGVEKLITDTGPNLFVTLAFNRNTTMDGAKQKLRLFQALMDGATVGNGWHKSPHRCRYTAVIENPNKNLHLHIAMCVAPEHRESFRRLAPAVWTKLCRGGTVDVQRIWNASGMADYITKQITPDGADRLICSDNG